jgi:hypothetical protein
LASINLEEKRKGEWEEQREEIQGRKAGSCILPEVSG